MNDKEKVGSIWLQVRGLWMGKTMEKVSNECGLVPREGVKQYNQIETLGDITALEEIVSLL